MPQSFDIVVVGAGSNSLVAAAYMARIDRKEQCGGGVVSIEIAPGLIHDPHASPPGTTAASPIPRQT